jgi:SAM-dependent methyltransferase
MTRLPVHQDSETNWYEKGDSGGYFPTAESAHDYRRLVEEQNYHQIRHVMIEHLLAEARRRRPDSALGRQDLHALDFGIGDGSEFTQLNLPVSRLTGIDTSAPMMDLATRSFVGIDFRGLVGGAEMLTQVEADLDLVTCINTLGYLSASEESDFWQHVGARLRTGGVVLIVTGNLLFDLFALNSGTATFFADEFGVGHAEPLLTRGQSERFRNARRKNPLRLDSELAPYGLRPVAENYCMWHEFPPELLLVNERSTLREARWNSRNFDVHALGLEPSVRWQAMFRCSVVGYVAVKD